MLFFLLIHFMKVWESELTRFVFKTCIVNLPSHCTYLSLQNQFSVQCLSEQHILTNVNKFINSLIAALAVFQLYNSKYLVKKTLSNNDWLIDWIEFYAISATFQLCNGGVKWGKEILIFITANLFQSSNNTRVYISLKLSQHKEQICIY